MRRSLIYLMALLFLVACKKDDDEAPVTDFVTEVCDIYIDADGVAQTATLDNGLVLDISGQQLRAEAADTLIRSVISYAWRDGSPRVYSNAPVYCSAPVPAEEFEVRYEHPVKLISVWQKGKYVNLSFGELTTGNGTHQYAFCLDSLKRRVLYVSFLHKRPVADAASYTQKRYASLPLRVDGVEAYDSVCLRIPTYEDVQTFTFPSASL